MTHNVPHLGISDLITASQGRYAGSHWVCSTSNNGQHYTTSGFCLINRDFLRSVLSAFVLFRNRQCEKSVSGQQILHNATFRNRQGRLWLPRTRFWNALQRKAAASTLVHKHLSLYCQRQPFFLTVWTTKVLPSRYREPVGTNWLMGHGADIWTPDCWWNMKSVP